MHSNTLPGGGKKTITATELHENRDGDDRNPTNQQERIYSAQKARGVRRTRGRGYLAALALLLLRGVPPGGIVGGAAGRGGGGPAPLHVWVPDEERSRNPSERNQQGKKGGKKGGKKRRRKRGGGKNADCWLDGERRGARTLRRPWREPMGGSGGGSRAEETTVGGWVGGTVPRRVGLVCQGEREREREDR